ncbi:MAG TPA: hypothetical protein VFM80_05490 [Gracilimonas sp.]|uniref:hypothetical protein n=1 Tax=Gracilimonas sp. TaxID=1974203 RepID=UPI002D8878DB|nr:hypothetical protein [Gracilimonas sp.]
MKTLILSTLIFLASSFSFLANAQVIAVMQAKVNVISGAGFTSLEESVIDLSSSNSLEEVHAGSFSLVASPGSDISIYISNHSEIKNNKGEALEFESMDVDRITSESGEHKVSVNGKVKNQQKLNGQYQGTITAVVEYL